MKRLLTYLILLIVVAGCGEVNIAEKLVGDYKLKVEGDIKDVFERNKIQNTITLNNDFTFSYCPNFHF